MRNKLQRIYRQLFRTYGAQNWWPGEGIEIALGAILTQQTSWINVEKALANLREKDCLSIDCLKEISIQELERLIYPSGYYKVKARRIKNLINLLVSNSHPSREDLLRVNGLGPETVDSILNYWFEEPIFVIDTYTFRIFERLGLYKESKREYYKMQKLFLDNLPAEVSLFNEYHALIVRHAKEYCLKKHPKCNICPLLEICAYPKNEKY